MLGQGRAGLADNHTVLVRMLVTIAIAATVAYGASAASVGRPIVFSDAFNFNVAAVRLLETGVFQYGGSPDMSAPPESNAFTTPGYTIFLSAVYAVVPPTGDTIESILRAQPYIIIVQLLLAIATAVVISLTGWVLDGPAVGWMAGVLAVAYLPFGMNATVTLTENLALPLMAVVLLSAVAMFRDQNPATRSRVLWTCLFGIAAGLSILVRPAIAPWLLAPLAMSLWVHRRHIKQEVKLIALAVACISLVMLPWVVRNAIVLGEFVPVSTGASTALLDSVGGAVFSELDEKLMTRAQASGDDPLQTLAVARLKARWAASPSTFLKWKGEILMKGVSSVTDLPGDIAVHVTGRGVGTAAYADAGKFPLMSSMTSHARLLKMLTWYHRILLALAGVGAVLGWRRPIVWILVLVPVHYAVAHTIVLFMTRYFYPAIPAIIVLAAFGLIGMFRLSMRRAGASPEFCALWRTT